MADFSFWMFFGGIGLFLLGMSLMTDGLKSASGPTLIKFLEKYTNTKIKGFFSGFLATTALQSSTATTLLAIGFVNTGILTFINSLWLLFGANVGSTMMPWIIAIMGGGELKISQFALPMIGIGVVLRMFEWKNIKSIGSVIVGFGLLFMGLDFLGKTFVGIDKLIPFENFINFGVWSILLFILMGFVLTIIMQSSAAVMAIIISLATAANLPLTIAAAAIIGANIGTTATAFFATIGATANAKRAAWAHIGFNIVAAIGACMILPFFVQFIDYFADIIKIGDDISKQLALFHTAFNILGVILMIPLSNFFANFLSKCFTKDEKMIEKPQFIDDTLLQNPPLAMEALIKEMERYRMMLISLLRGFLSYLSGTGSILPQDTKIDELERAIADFIIKLTKSEMSDIVATELRECLLVRDQYQKTSFYIKQLKSQFSKIPDSHDAIDMKTRDFLNAISHLLETIDTTIENDTEEFSEKNLHQIDKEYKMFKNTVIEAGTSGKISLEKMENLTELARTLKRMLSAFAKVKRMDLIVDGK